MSRIKAVVFDFGGVMTTRTMPEKVQAFLLKKGIDWAIVEAGYAKYRRLMDGGFITLREMYSLIWADNDIELTDADYEELLKVDAESWLTDYRNLATRDWMRELKANGFKLGILTNMPPAFAPLFREVYADFVELADAVVISGLERMFKPQQRIYRLMEKRLNLSPEEILFVDDVESNCAAAEKAGWSAIRFQSVEQARMASLRSAARSALSLGH